MNNSSTQSPAHAPPPKREPTRFDLLAVPCLLILIAAGQIVQANFMELSPWKGGGFGMFAAIDSPGMRFISVEALDEDGKPCTIEVGFQGMGEQGPFTSSIGRYLTCVPKQRTLQYIGVLLLKADLIPRTTNKDAILERFLQQNPALSASVTRITQTQEPVFRPRRPADIIEPGTPVIRLKAVRLQNWRLLFDHETAAVRCEPIGGPVELGDWS